MRFIEIQVNWHIKRFKRKLLFLQVKTINFSAQQEYKYDARVLRGLYLFVVRVRDGSPLADNVAVPRFFCKKSNVYF